MWVGTGTCLQVRKLPASIELESLIQSQYDIIRENIAAWQRDIDEEPISIEGIQSQFVSFQGSIHSLYQNALCSRVTDKLSYDIINTIGLLECIKKATNRYIRREMNELNAKFNNESVPTDIDTNEFVSGLRLVNNEVNPLMVTSGRSGLEVITNEESLIDMEFLISAPQVIEGGNVSG